MQHKAVLTKPITFLLGFLIAGASSNAFAPPLSTTSDDEPARRVAVTIDDLPASALMGEQRCDRQHQIAINRRLTSKLSAYGVPAVGFVNEGRPYCESMAESFVREILTMWLDAGLEIGNHTYSHGSLETTPVETFQTDVLRGEKLSKELLSGRGKELRYFRHPYLDTGADENTRIAFEHFLEEHGYTVAPVTIDNDEWIFAGAYAKALVRGDTAEMRRIGQAYLRYMEDVFAFYEEFSLDLLGYELPQVLLIHANALNADYFEELAEMIKRRGYDFVPLAEALEDSAYRRGDPYTGTRGLSWLQRWLIGKGEKTRMEPPVPVWIREALNR